ncbi:MAG: HAD hydrolase family protein [Desulfurococcaceae archaeon TW002]
MPTDFRLSGKAIILTDIDDTMLPLTQESSLEELRSFLSKLRILGIEVIPVTFKTHIEIEELMRRLNHDFLAYVIEGGCAIYAVSGFLKSGSRYLTKDYEVLELCNSISLYEELLTLVEKNPDCFEKALRLTKANPENISEILRIPLDLIRLSQKRVYSEVFVTQYTPCREFIASVTKSTNLKIIQTRRAVHLLEANKDKATYTLLKNINTVGRETPIIGLGDNPADEGILNHSDIPVIISENRVEWFKNTYYMRSLEKPPQSWIEAVKRALTIIGIYL